MIIHDITVAKLVSQNSETVAMFLSQTNPVGLELISHVICSNKFAWLLAAKVETLYR